MDDFSTAFADAIRRAGMRNDFIASKIGASSNQVSQWRRGRRPVPAHFAPNLGSILSVPPEEISSAYARLIEAGLAVEPREISTPKAHVRIPRLPDFGRPEDVEDCYLLELLARRKVGATPLEDTRWTLQPNATMSPAIERDAVVLVDIRATDQAQVMDGAIYAFTIWGRSDIRRILVRRDHWLLVGQSAEVERIEVYEPDLKQIRLYGMVVGWL